MLVLAKKYRDEIQFAFKPHHLLKYKLIQLWGADRVEAYYQTWKDMDNTQLEESGYEDLFIGSDAMVHDSGSFVTEYLYVDKPVMFLLSDSMSQANYHTFGKMAFDNHYKGRSIEDIERFINDVVLKGDDPMKASRKDFYTNYLVPQDGLLPSQKIMRVIEDYIATAN